MNEQLEETSGPAMQEVDPSRPMRLRAEAPVGGLTVLYDAGCGLCVRCRQWLSEQDQLVPLSFMPQGEAATNARFPGLAIEEGGRPDDLIVVSDDGRVWRNTSAWIICFYALRDYRGLAIRLSHPALRPLARRAYELVSRHRLGLSTLLGGGVRGTQRRLAATPEPVRCAPGLPPTLKAAAIRVTPNKARP